jgi:hypothetical protein
MNRLLFQWWNRSMIQIKLHWLALSGYRLERRIAGRRRDTPRSL